MEILNAVERVGAYTLVVLIIRHHVPSFAKYLHTIWLYYKSRGFISPETLIGYFNHEIVAHGFNYGREVFSARRNFFKENPSFEMMTFVNQIIYGKGVEQPIADATLRHIVGVFYIIAVAILFVALNIDFEHVFYGLPPVVEGAERQLASFTYGIAFPFLTDFLKGDSFGSINGID